MAEKTEEKSPVPVSEKMVLIPCHFGEDGKFSAIGRPPYGYHHLVKVYNNNPYDRWLMATIWGKIEVEKAEAVARLLAEELPLEVDRDFYCGK